MGSKDLNPGPHAWKRSALFADPSLQTPSQAFFRSHFSERPGILTGRDNISPGAYSALKQDLNRNLADPSSPSPVSNSLFNPVFNFSIWEVEAGESCV